jgi:hypothetical protein
MRDKPLALVPLLNAVNNQNQLQMLDKVRHVWVKINVMRSSLKLPTALEVHYG